jgi:glycosyltransferase involved in cell wall biosynthesis
MPEVSISIPTYNGAAYLKECLDSAATQTFADIEIIVVDDCSTDETFTIAEEFARRDNRVKIFRNKARLGLVENWNRCIQYSTGEWIKFLFQDDVLYKNCVKTMLNAAESTERGVTGNFVVSERNFVIEDGIDDNLRDFYENSVITLKDIFRCKFCISPEEFSEAILKRGVGVNFVGEPTSVMIRRAICFQYSFFNRNLVHLCDLEYWTRIATNEQLVYIPDKLLDKVVLLHDYLYHPCYENLRRTPNSETILSNHLKYEMSNLVGLTVVFDKPENMAHFRSLTAKYPILSKYLDEGIG